MMMDSGLSLQITLVYESIIYKHIYTLLTLLHIMHNNMNPFSHLFVVLFGEHTFQTTDYCSGKTNWSQLMDQMFLFLCSVCVFFPSMLNNIFFHFSISYLVLKRYRAAKAD